MKKIQDQLISISKSLATLSNQVEILSKHIEIFQPLKATASKKAKGPEVEMEAVKKTAEAKPLTVLDSVFEVVKRSRKGATIAKLKEKTGLEAKQLSNALYKLSKKGKIKATARGLYVKK